MKRRLEPVDWYLLRGYLRAHRPVTDANEVAPGGGGSEILSEDRMSGEQAISSQQSAFC